MTDQESTEPLDGDRDPVAILLDAVTDALRTLLHHQSYTGDTARTALTRLTTTTAPVLDQLNAAASGAPGGLLAEALDMVKQAHQDADRSEEVRTALIGARTVLFRLRPPATPPRPHPGGQADPSAWRF